MLQLAAGHNPSYVFRGYKSDIYEGGHRIPLLIQWPETIRKNSVCDQIVCLSDFMATISEILGVELKENEGVDSVSNLPLWLDADNPAVRNDIIHQSMLGHLSIRRGKYKLEMCPGSGGWSYPTLEEVTPDMPRFQLYDLENDISEKVNVIDQHPSIAEFLRKLLLSQIENGRSTPGPKQKNDGVDVWNAVAWMKEESLF